MPDKEEKEKVKSLEIRLSLLKKEDDEHVEHTTFEITDQDLCKEIYELLGAAVAQQTDVDSHPEDLDAHKFELDGVSWADKKKKLEAEKAKKSA